MKIAPIAQGFRRIATKLVITGAIEATTSAGLLALALAAPAAPPPPASPPTVLLITLDTTRADRLGCYGRVNAGTPNLDKLAASGVKFGEAWSVAPITLPSHLTVMTGCSPVTLGVRDNGMTKYDGRIPTLARRFAAAGYETAAVVSAGVLDATWGANAGFGIYDDKFDKKEERTAGAATKRALEIAGAAKGPLFLWVHYYDAHWKYEPPAPFAERFKDDLYQGEIAYVDSEIGRLLAGLEKAGRKPIVVVVGDHGEGLGEHGERTHGIFTYRSTLRVPMLIAGPGIPAGRVVGEVVSLIDVAPTVGELAGLPKAKRQDGLSLAGVVKRGAAPSARTLYFESMLPFDSYGWVPPRGVTDGRYVFVDLPKREVYDLRSDPAQAHNLYAEGDGVSSGLVERFGRVTHDLAAGAGQGSTVGLSEEQRARFAAMGYVSAGSGEAKAPTLDPKDVVDLADKVDQAKEAHAARKDDEALKLADEIVRRNPENVPALSVKGQALLSMKRYAEAAAAFGDAVARSPSIAVNRFDLGSSLAGMGEGAKAEAEWRKAIELDPRFAEPRASLIAAVRGRGDQAGALALSKEAAASGAESAEVAFEIGLTYATSGDLDQAQRWFETTMRLRPDHVQALGNLGRIAYEKGRIDEALGRYRAASRAAPHNPQFLEQTAAILLNDKHDVAGALVAFRAALAVERDPGERAKLTQMIEELSAVR